MATDLPDFSGKVALVTGGSTGIGRAVAPAFAQHGAKVAIGDLNEEAARETVQIIDGGLTVRGMFPVEAMAVL